MDDAIIVELKELRESMEGDRHWYSMPKWMGYNDYIHRYMEMSRNPSRKEYLRDWKERLWYSMRVT